MRHKGQESSSRKLVWVEGQNFEGWGCSECAWVFNPSNPPIGKSLDEMTRFFRRNSSKSLRPTLAPSTLGSKGRSFPRSQQCEAGALYSTGKSGEGDPYQQLKVDLRGHID